MKYIVSNHTYHITHNDSDALGCALVVDFYYLRNSLVQTNYNSIETSKDVISNLVNCLEIIYGINNIEVDTNTDEEFIKFKEYTFGWLYDSSEVICIPKNIIITDLPVDPFMLDRLDKIAQKGDINLLYIDHHASNLENNLRYPWCHVKATDEQSVPRSACKYLYDYLIDNYGNIIEDNDTFKSAVIKNLINDISRYDTWLWKNDPKTKPNENYATVLINNYGDIKTVHDLIFENICNDDIENDLCDIPEFATLINIDRDKRNLYIKKYMKNVVYFTDAINICIADEQYRNTRFAMIILPEIYSNDIMVNIYLNTDIDIVIGIFPTSRTVSFRRNPNCNIDLGEFAKRYYGGGGHKAASGAKLSTETFMMFLTTYYGTLDSL